MLNVATESFEILSENPLENETLAEVFSGQLWKTFKNTFFMEHLRLTGSDIRRQVVVIYNLNLFLQFATINFALRCEFSRWSMLQCRLHF